MSTSNKYIESIKYLSATKSNLIENYIYLYHVDKFLLLPTYPESVSDSLQANFGSTNPLARSAPIFSYQNSGPRSVVVSLNLHRDMLYQVNVNKSNLIASDELETDYVDKLVRELQAIALPVYATAGKMVNPPMIAIKIGDDIFIKGIVQGGIGLEYSLPIIKIDGENKYAQVKVNFTVTEVDPYDATTVMNTGSFRGLDRTLERY